ncbi:MULTISPECIES: polysaccharide biosynthesis tyrosine autokinase [Halomonadaceae]|uniref:polysaccharide biosynthesis tyrosine autokinase n=1 Tax=Halomonadaceae TaxID=28256 RepID=UPI001598E5C8|nr:MULTISPECIES: polysaccharide biosynthesis tyrosine autokinase [Halomonas]QJQ94000.1 polysaccharide biosynthesis tyrosine autokinase [Halomonas sp. PA5]
MSDKTTTQAPAEEVINLGRLFGVLFDHKWLIAIVTALFAMLGIAYGMLATPIYQADALVQVERRSNVSPLGDVGNIIGLEQLNTPAEIQILQSRLVLGQVVDRLGRDIIIRPVTLPVVGDFVIRRNIPRPGFMEGYPHVWGDEQIEVTRFELADSRRGQQILVERDINNRYRVLINGESIGVGELGANETFLDGDLQLLIDTFDAGVGARYQLMKQARTSAIGSIGGRLQISEAAGRGTSTGMLRLSMVGPDTQEIVRTLDAVADTFLTQNVERQAAQAEQSLTFLEEQAPELRDQLVHAEQSLNEYRAGLDSVDLSSEAQAAIQRYIELESSLNELEFQEAELARRYTSSHPTYQALLRQKRQIEQDRQELNARVNELPAAQQEVVRRTRDVEVTQAIYVNVLNKIQELQVARAGTIGNVRIIDRAAVGGLVAPNRARIAILATLLGAILAVGGVLLRELLRRGVDSPEQIEAAGLPVYATIPLSPAQNKLARRIKKKRRQAREDIVVGVLADREPADLALEALRGLRTSLHFTMMEGRNNRLMITGPSPGVGKSFISINLGAVSAQAGKRVLLIDADLRKGHIHHAFGKQSKNGLADYLAGQIPLDDIIQPTGIDNYWLVTRGTAPPNPSELLMQPRFAEAMELLSQRFDMVIVDTPPVLAVTDASVVGKQCDTTLLVTRFETNPIREIMAAKRRLEGNGLQVQGAILNAMERKASTASGHYGYYFYSYR